MNLVKGEAEVFPKTGRSFDPVEIPKAIHDAGFTATQVLVTADGVLARRSGSLQLEVPGLKHPFVITGGPKGDALAGRTDLLGKKVLLVGKLWEARSGAPPGLTVEDFGQAP